MKKAQGLSLNVIIIAIIALLVLVSVTLYVKQKYLKVEEEKNYYDDGNDDGIVFIDLDKLFEEEEKPIEICYDLNFKCNDHVTRCDNLTKYQSNCLIIGSSCKITASACLLYEGEGEIKDLVIEIEKIMEKFWTII